MLSIFFSATPSKMADIYCYQLVEATPYLERVIDHLLSSANRESLPKPLSRELEGWRERETGVEFKEGVVCDCKVIKFSTVKEIKKQLKETPLDGKSPFIHELLQGSRIVFPRQQAPPRNPELVARLETIKASLENAEYNKMVFGKQKKDETLKDIKLDVQATHRQLLVMFNFFLTVVGSFIFGYFAAYYAGMDSTACFATGLVFGLAVLFADVYFIIKQL